MAKYGAINNSKQKTLDATQCLSLQKSFATIKANDTLIITKVIGLRKIKHITFRGKVASRNDNVIYCKTLKGYESINFADVVTGKAIIRKYSVGARQKTYTMKEVKSV